MWVRVLIWIIHACNWKPLAITASITSMSTVSLLCALGDGYFPDGQNTPFRIELFDDEIETLRTFDVESQRTLDKVSSIRILPAREFPLNASAIRIFKSRWFDFFPQDQNPAPVYMDVSQGIATAGVEYYLPLFLPMTSGISLNTCRKNAHHSRQSHGRSCQSVAQRRRRTLRKSPSRYSPPHFAANAIILAEDQLLLCSISIRAYNGVVKTRHARRCA